MLALGSDCYDVVKRESEATPSALEEWEDVTTSTDFVFGEVPTHIGLQKKAIAW